MAHFGFVDANGLATGESGPTEKQKLEDDLEEVALTAPIDEQAKGFVAADGTLRSVCTRSPPFHGKLQCVSDPKV